MSIQENLQEAKDNATKALKFLDNSKTKEELTAIAYHHIRVMIEVVDPNDKHIRMGMGQHGVALFMDSIEVIRAFFEKWEETNDVPTIAHNMAVKRHEYLYGLYNAIEEDLTNEED